MSTRELLRNKTTHFKKEHYYLFLHVCHYLQFANLNSITDYTISLYTSWHFCVNLTPGSISNALENAMFWEKTYMYFITDHKTKIQNFKIRLKTLFYICITCCLLIQVFTHIYVKYPQSWQQVKYPLLENKTHVKLTGCNWYVTDEGLHFQYWLQQEFVGYAKKRRFIHVLKCSQKS